MIGPREVFTSQAVVFMSASSAAPISPRVRRLRIKWTVTTSAWRKSSFFVQGRPSSLGDRGCHVLAPGDDPHAEGPADARDLAADLAKAEHAQNPALELPTD